MLCFIHSFSPPSYTSLRPRSLPFLSYFLLLSLLSPPSFNFSVPLTGSVVFGSKVLIDLCGMPGVPTLDPSPRYPPTSCYYCGWSGLKNLEAHVAHTDISCWHPQSPSSSSSTRSNHRSLDPELSREYRSTPEPPRCPPSPRHDLLSVWPRTVEAAIWDLDPDSGAGIVNHLRNQGSSLLSSFDDFLGSSHRDLRKLFDRPHTISWARELSKNLIHVQQVVQTFFDNPWDQDIHLPQARVLHMERPMGGMPDSFATHHPRPPDNWSWLEFVAQGFQDISGQALSRLPHEVFTEQKCIDSVNNQLSPESPLWRFSFAERCRQSGASHLSGLFVLDKGLSASKAPQWKEPPQKRIRTSYTVKAIDGCDPRAFRTLQHLACEGGLRIELQSISKSWETVASQWTTWGQFMSSYFPMSRHFPADWSHIRSFVNHFSNADSLVKYLQAVRKGHLVLRLDPNPADAIITLAKRGALSLHQRPPKGRIVKTDFQVVQRRLTDAGLIAEARFMAVNRLFMFRVADEGAPLQLDGRHGLESSDTRWHSYVQIKEDRVSVHLRTRKNAQSGSVVRRRCVCRQQTPLLCGVCCLRAQIDDHVAALRAPTAPLFGNVNISKLLALVKKTTHEMGIGIFTWHWLRRGFATDLLRSGTPIAEIITAGGWRSAAFIRYLLREDIDEAATADRVFAQSDSN